MYFLCYCRSVNQTKLAFILRTLNRGSISGLILSALMGVCSTLECDGAYLGLKTLAAVRMRRFHIHRHGCEWI